MGSQSSSRFSHQIDLSSWPSPSKFFEFLVSCFVVEAEKFCTDETKCEFENAIPRKQIPK
jgi:hypothetical protein